MEIQNSRASVLDRIPYPAFYESDGQISQLNQAAEDHGLQIGQQILPMLFSGREEYAELKEGCLYLTLTIGDQKAEATVVADGSRRLFLLERPDALAELRALSLAAEELRVPLTAMFSSADQLWEQSRDASAKAQFNRRLHQLLRIVSNMSDAYYYCGSDRIPTENLQICSFLEELLEKAREYLLSSNIHLTYTLPRQEIIIVADREKLERAVYNLISNAVKHTAPGGQCHFELTCRDRLYLSMTDGGFGTAEGLSPNAYTRYLRSPSLSDGQEGIGLGMVLIRATAANHNGVVLIDHPEGRGTRVTMTMELHRGGVSQIRSPRLHPDYAGERDHCLQELADVLSPELYTPEK